MTEGRARGLPPAWLGVSALVMSGFAGLVYEATWARYLKGVLGHEAYAQALVLGIFLGGLAAGAALAGRHIGRIRHPLVGYAVIEAVLALAAVYFHDVFVAIRGALEGGAQGASVPARWVAMTLMIAPQSVMLGATFPLLAAAMTRSDPERSGRTVAALYFANSFGGVVGSLSVGFFLVDLGGLPGSMYGGALASGAAGLVAWAGHHRYDTPSPIPARDLAPTSGSSRPGLLHVLALVSFGTGLASLVYEIVWIRMLALVVGSSTRAFEIMLAAFILGLALGGLFIRRWTDRPGRLRLLAWAQLLMGTSVIATLFSYEELFRVLEYSRASIPKSDAGYLVYGFVCFLISLALMFLPTFLAGMTLPLLTREAMASRGERSIGAVYAWNTLGAIAGILLAVHVLLPAAGIKHALTIGAAVDLGLGAMLIRLAQPRLFRAGLAAAAAAAAAALVHAPLDPKLLMSGPYRQLPKHEFDIVFHEDGKTSSIFVTETPYSRSLVNNGKGEGALTGTGDVDPLSSYDMQTNTVSAALALMHRPDARAAGVIGVGTGLTANTLLLSDELGELETIEIEPAVLEALDFFWAADDLRTDPRSRLIEGDAKTHMASKPPGSYDIIVSIPSNPWVSGVSNLFTVEHFRHMRRSLSDDGVLVQWFHLYESNPEAVASIVSAVTEVFPDYMLFQLSRSDVALVTSPDPDIPGRLRDDALEKMPRLAKRLKLYNIRSVNDARTTALGNREFFEPYFDTFRIGPNSDYFPHLDRHAALGFFRSTHYSLLFMAEKFGHLFNGGALPGARSREPHVQVTRTDLNPRQEAASLSLAALDASIPLSVSFREVFEGFKNAEAAEGLFDTRCSEDDQDRLERSLWLLDATEFHGAALYREEMERYWRRVTEEVPCLEEIRGSDHSGRLLDYMEAMATGSTGEVVASVDALLGRVEQISSTADATALTRMMAAMIEEGRPRDAVKESLRLNLLADVPARHAVRLIGAHALAREEGAEQAGS